MSDTTRTPTDRTHAPKPRRWLAGVIAATATPDALPAMPFQRGKRRRPAALVPAAARGQAIAAR